MTRSATTGEPETEAGRRVLNSLGFFFTEARRKGYMSEAVVGVGMTDYADAVLAIEAEAGAKVAHAAQAQFDEYEQEIAALRAEMERLREAAADLLDVVDRATLPWDDTTTVYDCLAVEGRKSADALRAALGDSR